MWAVKPFETVPVITVSKGSIVYLRTTVETGLWALLLIVAQ